MIHFFLKKKTKLLLCSLQKNKVTFSNIFEEIPIRIQTSILAGVLLRQLDSNGELKQKKNSFQQLNEPHK